MSLLHSFRPALLLAALPAMLAFSACGNDDDPDPDRGQVRFIHAAANANIGVKFLVDDNEKANLTYGQTSDYQRIDAGSRTFKVNVASSNSTVATQTATVAKDQRYSFFAYANTATTQGGLLATDDLTAPSSNKAKIRLVHLGQGTLSPLKLSTTAGATADIVGTQVQFGNASPFIEVNPGQYNVAVTTGATSTTITNGNVGNGSGSGTSANYDYQAGKIYTVLVRGVLQPTLAADLQPKIVLIQNN